MSMDASHKPNRGGGKQDLWPKWMWIAVPVLVVVVVVGLWWAIFAPTGDSTPAPTPTATVKIIQDQPTQAPTKQQTLDAAAPTPTKEILPELPTHTPEAEEISTPSAETEGEGGNTTGETGGGEEMVVGAKVAVTGTGGTGLNMRTGAGTGHARVKTLSENSIVELVGGPQDSDGFTWWQVQDQAGSTGWVAAKYLVIK